MTIGLLLLLSLAARSGLTLGSVDQKSVAPSYWSDARAYAFQLSELLSPVPDQAVLSNPSRVGSVDVEAYCMSRQVAERSGDLSCPAAIYKRAIQADEALSVEFLRNALRNLRQTDATLDWRDRIYFAAALIKEQQIELAASYVDESIAELSKTLNVADWVIQRFRVYRGLISLLEAIRNGETPNGLKEFSDVDPARFSSPALDLKLASVRGFLPTDDGQNNHPEEHEAAIRLINFEKWRLDQERDEIRAVVTRIRESGLNADVIARTNLLVEKFNANSPQWQALVQVIARTSSDAELFSRNHEFTTKLDVWLLTYIQGLLSSPRVGDDSVVRVDLVSQHFVTALQKVLLAIEQANPTSLETERGRILKERLDSMTGSFHQLAESVTYQPSVRVFRGLVESALRCRETLHRLQARMVAFENTSAKDAELFQQIKTLSVEAIESRKLFFQLLQSAALQLHINNPIVHSSLEVITKRLGRFQATVDDIEIFSQKSRRPLRAEVFNELRALLKKMVAVVKESNERKTSEVVSFRNSLAHQAEEIRRINKDAKNLFDGANSKVGDVVIRVLESIDSNLVEERRRFDFEIAAHRAALADTVAQTKDQLESALKELNDVERLRRENLEWRLAQ